METLMHFKLALSTLMHQQYIGMPLWAWLLLSMPAVNEAINRSKWTRAQSLWQGAWLIVRISPFGKIPIVGEVIAKMALPKAEREAMTAQQAAVQLAAAQSPPPIPPSLDDETPTDPAKVP